MPNTRYALRTVTTQPGSTWYVHALAKFTMPSSTDDVRDALTWASARGAKAAAKRHGLTNVVAVPVVGKVNGFGRFIPAREI